ncbi:MAG: hypothetical protein AAF821_21685 [Cyanobacteria bacterium P01_D01_bin.156]
MSKRFLWLTFDFASCLSTSEDTVTPQIFLTLMAHPAISQLKRFTTQSHTLGPDDVTQWEPGIFTAQVYRPNLLEVLTQVSSCLSPHLFSGDASLAVITVYTQLGSKHYPVATCLEPVALNRTAEEIEAMVSQYEQKQATVAEQ